MYYRSCQNRGINHVINHRSRPLPFVARVAAQEAGSLPMFCILGEDRAGLVNPGELQTLRTEIRAIRGSSGS